MADRPVLITGASTGIGEATALRLARRGHKVYAGVRRAEDGERLRAAADGELIPLRLDVTDHAEIRLAADELDGEPLTGLVNNAGIAVGGPLETIPLEDFRHQIEVNLTGQLAVTQAFLPNLREAQGRIVNVTSIGGRVASPFMAAYNAAKFGLEALTDSLRMELLPWGIEVIAVEPGTIKTEIWRKGRGQFDHIKATLGERGEDFYGETIESMKGTLKMAEDRGIKADRAARVIEKALTARRPKTRYLVGFDARAMLAMRTLLPDRIADRLHTRGMGVPSG